MYRFPNANWLTQVGMAAVHRAFGIAGLCVLQAALVAGIVVLGLVTVRRLGVPWPLAAAGAVLTVLVAYPRFSLRPEVFGYLVLSAQLALLASVRRSDGTDGRLRWSAAVALVAAQLLFVNLHSYFLLGVALTGAFAADAAMRLAWRRVRELPRDEAARVLKSNAARLGLVLAAQLAACFVNPWTWRLAALPVQTMAFLRANDIASSGRAGTGHPWSLIGEFFSPFARGGFAEAKATYASWAMLALSAVAMLAALSLRRWAWLLVLGGMTAVAVSMRRNIAPAAIVAVPVALGAVWPVLRWLGRRASTRARAAAALATAAGTFLVAAALGAAVGTQGFYYHDRSPLRFGTGLSDLTVPVAASRWLNEHDPQGRLWTDYTSSSNFHYLTVPHRDVPVVTNTWAYPPEVMAEVLAYCFGRRDFARAVERYGIEVVALRVERPYAPLARALAGDPAWALVHLHGWHAVFVRRAGPNAELARRFGTSEDSFDAGEYAAALRSLDAVPAYALHLGGVTLYQLGWDSPAIEVLREATREDPNYHRTWNVLGLCHARRGLARLQRSDHRGRQDWEQARTSFQRALALRPGYEAASANLSLVERQIAALRQGVLLEPRR